IIAVVTWFAAIFYLPRLFVYHASADDQVSRERFKIMERKLYRGIMTPSVVVVVALGSWLISFNQQYYLIESHWLHAKLILVTLLIVYHFYCGHLLKILLDCNKQRSHVFHRFFNEVPVFLLIAILILSIVEPF